MPEETHEALERSARARTGLRKFVGVPDSWEGWAIRVLTVAVILTLVTQAVLGAAVARLTTLTVEQSAFMRDSREQRVAFQQQETERQCEILRRQGATADQLKALKC